ncbi:hypothetical protein Tco_0144185 [Tanacetum coccineum]
MTHPHPKRSFVPQAVLTRTGKVNTVGASINTVNRPINTAASTPLNNINVNTARVKNTTARDRAVVSENKGKRDNAVKALACWGNPQQKEYKEKAVIDSGCSRNMTGNKCYLDEYEDYDGGFVSFGDGKGRISRKVAAGNKTNSIAGTKDNIVAGQAQKEKEPEQEYILIPLCTADPLISQGLKDCEGDARMKPTEVDENEALDKSGKHDQ